MPIALGYRSHINISDVNYIIEERGVRRLAEFRAAR